MTIRNFHFTVLVILQFFFTIEAFALDNCTDSIYFNPILYADWPDPDVIRVEDDFYLVTTSMHFVPGSPILKSKDLITWDMVGYAVESYDEDARYNLIGGDMYTGGSWANSIRYRDKLFYVGFCTPDKWGKRGQFSMCTASTPAGPWKRTIFPEYMYDPGILFDDDGKVYVAHGQGKIFINELHHDALSVKTSQKQVYYNPAHPYLEGSHFYRINKMYYMLSSSSGTQMVCLRSENIFGPYEEKIVLKDSTAIDYTTYPPHQGGMVQLKDSTWWMIIMQDYGPLGRTSNLIPVNWVDGWPMLGENGKMTTSHKKPIIINTEKQFDSAKSDEFESCKLGLQWQWNHNPDTTMFSLTQNPGFIRLISNKAEELSVARNTLTQRVVGPYSSATVAMSIEGMKDGNVAGFGIFQKPYSYIAVRQVDNKKQIVFNKDMETIVLVNDLQVDTIWFQISVSIEGYKASLYYSTDAKTFQKAGTDFDMDLGYPWTANRFAMINFSTKDEGVNGYVDFDWLRFKKEELNNSSHPYALSNLK